MNTTLHRGKDRGKGEYGWLHTRYSFSFADWYAPERMGFGALRVLNDDVVDPGRGFDPHSHRDMEIITIVTGGAVSHRDSMGHEYTVPAGDVQVMSAGTGVTHAEYNQSPDTPLTLFQVWIEPRARNLSPCYAQRSYQSSVRNAWVLLAAPAEESNALLIQQDAFLYTGQFDGGQDTTYHVRGTGHGVYLFVVEGRVEVAGETLEARDALGITDAASCTLRMSTESKVLLFEVPMHTR